MVAVAAVLFGGRLGDRGLWAEEYRWAEIPRNMARSADYFWPNINGRTYYDKPLGSYWLVLVAAAAAGGEVTETAARLPSAVAGLLGVGLVVGLGRRLYDGPTGAAAGLVLATSFGYVSFARTAAADAEAVTGVLLAVTLGLRARADPAGWRVGLMWAVMAATSLTKGLTGVVLPVLILGVDAVAAAVTRKCGPPVPRADSPAGPEDGCRVRDAARNPPAGRAGRVVGRVIGLSPHLFGWAAVPAAVAATALYFAPFVASAAGGGLADGLDMVWRENVRRFTDAHNHKGPVTLYAGVVFALLGPWALVLPAALAQAHSRWRADRFPLVYFWSLFVFFTLASSRRSYYLLPILPAAALLVARLLTTPAAELTRPARRLLRAGFALTAAVTVAAGVLLVPPGWVWADPARPLPPLPAPGVFALFWLDFGRRRRAVLVVRFTPDRVTAALGVIAVGATGYLFLAANPEVEAYRPRRQFLAEVRATVGPDLPRVALYKTRDAAFYLDAGRPLAEPHTPAELAAAGAAWVVCRRADAAEVGGREVLAEPVFWWDGAGPRAEKYVLVRR